MTQEFEALRTATNQTDHEQASRQYAKMVCGQDCNQESLSDYEDEDFVAYQQRGLQPPVLPSDYVLYKKIKEHWMQEADCFLGKSDKLPTTRGKDADGQLQDNVPKSAAEPKNEPVEPQQIPTGGTESNLPQLPPTPPKSVIIKNNRLDKLFKDLGVSDEPLSEEFWLDVSQPYQPQSFLFELDGIPCIRKGDFSCITGKFGNGKSQFVAMLAAAALKGGYFTMKYLQNDEPKVLIIDTEQGVHDSKAEQCKIFDMCEFPVNTPISNFRMARLRSIYNPKEMLDYMGRAIKSFNPNVLIIDGLLDLIEDFNDIKESRNLVRICMELAEALDIGLIAILHLNPSGDKATGNIGSIALRKATDFLEVHRQEGGSIYEVKSQKARGHKMIKDWKFTISDSSLWGRPEPIQQPDFSSTEISIEDIEQALRDNKDSIQQPFTKENLKAFFKEQLNVANSNKLSECVKMAENKRLIVAQEKKEYEPNQKHPKYYINI